MPRAWRFTGRSAALPPRCATPDSPRLLADVTAALIDREAIDWRSLLSHADPADKSAVESLRFVEAIRSAASGTSADVPNPHPSLPIRAVTALATLQTLCSLALILLAVIHGTSVLHRTPQIMLAAAFTLAGALLAVGTARDFRRVSLVATF